MKLEHGTQEDHKFRDAMYHEFTLCEQAFDEFRMLANINIHGNSDYKLLEKTYKSYSAFVEHLYEFYVACFKRNKKGNTDDIPHDELDRLFTMEVEKLMTNICSLIENNRAPSWINDISYYQEPVPPEFGEKFRAVRNNSSHVDIRRVGGGNRPTLKEFLDKYHKFMFFLYDSARELWGSNKSKPRDRSHKRV